MRRLVPLLILALVAAGCQTGGDRAQAVFDRIEPRLSQFWAYTFAGLRIDGDRLIVYRTLDPPSDIDETVRGWADGVEVEFRDARYSLDDLNVAVRRVDADRTDWQRRGITITAVIPRDDGAGVATVLRQNADLRAAQIAFDDRYRDPPVVATKLDGALEFD